MNSKPIERVNFVILLVFDGFFSNFKSFFSKIDQWRCLVAEFGINETTPEKLLWAIMT